MCVGRYAAKVMRNERSEMEHSRSEMPAKGSITICIPAGCDFSIIWQFDVVAFRGMHNIGISIAGICPNKFERAKGSKRFHFASLHYIFSAYLPTHIKFLTEFHRIFFGTTCISFLFFFVVLSRNCRKAVVELLRNCCEAEIFIKNSFSI